MTNQALFDRVMAQLSSEYTDVVIMTGVYTKDFALELATLIRAEHELALEDADCGLCHGYTKDNVDYLHDPDCTLIALLKALDGEPK